MPYTLPAVVSRRRFLLGSVAAAAVGLGGGDALRAAFRDEQGAADAPPDPDRLILLSDTHIAADPTATKHGVNMFDNLWRAGEEAAAARLRACATLVTGDLAVTAGATADYATFARAIRPLRAAGMPPLYLAMGNHDHFDRFHAAFPPAPGVVAPAAAKRVTVVETARANLFVLDSLAHTNATPGTVGRDQLRQLAEALDARRDKPAIVFVHHHPSLAAVFNGGLTDTPALFDAIVPRRQVKAVVFGHTHVWSAARHEGIHLINLPPTAFVFWPRNPNGWVDLLLRDGGATFTLHAVDKGRRRDGEQFDVAWRADV